MASQWPELAQYESWSPTGWDEHAAHDPTAITRVSRQAVISCSKHELAGLEALFLISTPSPARASLTLARAVVRTRRLASLADVRRTGGEGAGV